MSSDPNLPSDPTPLPPVGTSVAPLAPASAQTTDVGLPANLAAAICLTFIGGLIFLFLEKRNQFVRFWAMQSIYFGIVWFLFGIASIIIGIILRIVLLGWLWNIVAWIISLGFFVIWVVAIIQALTGKAWEFPVIGKLARQQLAKMPTI